MSQTLFPAIDYYIEANKLPTLPRSTKRYTCCKACGKPLIAFDESHLYDGLCKVADTWPLIKEAGCFVKFLDFAMSRKVQILRRLDQHFLFAIDWSSPEVNVLFDEWLENTEL